MITKDRVIEKNAKIKNEEIYYCYDNIYCELKQKLAVRIIFVGS